MIVKTSLKLGGVSYQFEFDEKHELDTLSKAIVLSNPLSVCPMCDNKDKELFHFTSNRDKEGNIYVNVKCKCGARSKLGQYKSGGYFWRGFERPIESRLKPLSEPTKTNNEEVPDLTDADFPF